MEDGTGDLSRCTDGWALLPLAAAKRYLATLLGHGGRAFCLGRGRMVEIKCGIQNDASEEKRKTVEAVVEKSSRAELRRW